MTTLRDPTYAGYRFPAELIAYAVWLYFRVPVEPAHAVHARSSGIFATSRYGFDLVILVPPSHQSPIRSLQRVVALIAQDGIGRESFSSRQQNPEQEGQGSAISRRATAARRPFRYRGGRHHRF